MFRQRLFAWASLTWDESGVGSANGELGSIGQLQINPHTLEGTSVSNVRTCIWNRTHDPNASDGRELYSFRDGKVPFIAGVNYNTDHELDTAQYFDPCMLAYPWYCGWLVAPANLTERAGAYFDNSGTSPTQNTSTANLKIYQFKNDQIPETLMKQCTTPTLTDNLGWGGAGYIGFRATNPCQEYPASYIGDALWTYPHFCPKPSNGF